MLQAVGLSTGLQIKIYIYIGKTETLFSKRINMAERDYTSNCTSDDDDDPNCQWVHETLRDNDTNNNVELVTIVDSSEDDTDSDVALVDVDNSGDNNVGGLKADIQNLKSTNRTVDSIFCQPSQNDDPKCVEINLFKDNHKVADLKFKIEYLPTTHGNTKINQEYITITVNAVVEDNAGIIKCIRHYVTLLSGNNQLFKATVADQ